MKKMERLDETVAPDGTVLTLYRRDRDYFVRAGVEELMSTRRHASEDQLAELVCAPLQEVAAPHVLVGGLGLGFTLKAALRALPADARVTVVELLEAVIRWNRDPEYDLGAAALADPRVTLRHADVADVLEENPAGFDGIMLDVDNGATAMTTARNARLYRREGMRRAAAALRPGGRLAYWSAEREVTLERGLRGGGLEVEIVTVFAHGTSGPKHHIHVGRRPGQLPRRDG
jgi:spermidine synthase